LDDEGDKEDSVSPAEDGEPEEFDEEETDS